MRLEVAYVNRMLGVLYQRADDYPPMVVDLQVVADIYAALIEERVVVRTETQEVVDGIRTRMRPSQCADVRAFRNRATRDL